MSMSLLTLFAPPDGYIGDFGMLCGFTASRDILDRIARTFSGDGSGPRLAAFIHPTAAAVTDVPGVTWMHFRAPLPFRLLHAKVALLGFRAQTGYCLRLAVSTGNWTAEPLTTSIDMFWCDEFSAGGHDLQLVSDIRAADDLFGWLRKQCDDSLLLQTFDGMCPDENFREAIKALPPSEITPRFVDTRKEPMRSQVIERLFRQRQSQLVIGSGYYEANNDTESEGLIESLRTELVQKTKLASDATLDLVLNPDNCQGLHAQAARLIEMGWRLRKAASCHDEHIQAKLHAKYMFLAQHAGLGEIGRAQVYIGSANFSRMGFESTLPGGNLEAGIVVTPDRKLSWRRNTRHKIRDFLPGDFDSEVELATLAVGAAYEPPPAPPTPPPVTFVEWANDHLSAPDFYNEEVEIVGSDERTVTLPCRWPAPPPAFVTLHPNGWKVPVRADGALVVPKSARAGLEDILAGIGRFPAFAIATVEDEDDCDVERASPSETPENTATTARAYPVRQMMRLITRLAEAQKELDPRDWQRWCREIRQDLPDLADTEPTMIKPFSTAGANPLPALADVEFLPSDVDADLIQTALRHVADAWGLSGTQGLWGRTS